MSASKIIKGTALIGSVNAARLFVQLFSVPVLARLLSPEDYGLQAMAMPVILFVMMIADAGLGVSLVRTKMMDDPEWHTCFWLSIGLGVAVASVVVALSPAIGFALNQPRLTPIIAVLAVIVPAQTLTMVPGAALQKQSRFGIIAVTEIVSTITSLCAAVGCAIEGLGVWALIWQQVVFYAVRLTLTLIFSPYLPRFVFNLSGASEHLIFGRNVLGTNLIGFVSRSMESLVIGKVHGPGPVGIYSMAFQFARLPFMLVTGPLLYVLYPYIMPIREDKKKLAQLFLLFTRVLAIIVLPAMGLIAVASDPIFHVLLSQKWGQAVPIFVLIAPAAALQGITAIIGPFMMALGRTDIQLWLALELAALWLVGLLGSVWYGIDAVAGTYSICAVLFSLWTLRVCLPLVGCTVGAYASALTVPSMLTVSAILLYQIIKSSTYEVWDVSVAATLAAAVISIPLLVQRRDLLASFSLASANGAIEPIINTSDEVVGTSREIA